MRRTIGRRAMFFWGTSLVCVALIPIMPSEFRWVAEATAGLGFFWAVLLSIEDLLAPRGTVRDRFEPAGPESPFAPPPPPARRPDDR
jgi:hypothetical protein